MASTSMFVACKDYDDDIKNLQAQIDKAALQTDLQALKTSLESELSTLKASLATAQAELAQKADKSALEALADKVTKLTERVSTIETKITAINEALDKKADKTELAALEAALTGKLEKLEQVLTEKLDAEEAARKAEDIKLQAAIDAANANIELQKQALEAAKTALEAKDAELQALIGANAEAIEALKTSMAAAEANIKKIQEETIPALEEKVDANATDIATLKEDMQEAAEAIDAIAAELDVLEVGVMKVLSSLVLKPAFYWEGLEGIEVPYISQTPVFTPYGPYEFTYTVSGTTQGDKNVKVKVDSIMSVVLADGSTFAVEGKKTGLEGKDLWAGRQDTKLSLAKGDIEEYVNPKKVKKIDISEGGIATYHVNPSTANLDGYTISFYENLAEVYTRAGVPTTISPEALVKDAGQYEVTNGIIEIPFKVNDNALATIFNTWLASNDNVVSTIGDAHVQAFGGGAKLPFIAAQMTKTADSDDDEDRIVTSDYAVVLPGVYTIVALADNAPETTLSQETFVVNEPRNHKIRDNHLYESVGYDDATDNNSLGAIPMPATHSVAYNGSIDLSEFVETHFTYESKAKYGYADAEQVMSEETMNALGLHYNFTIVNYTVGTNKTGESKHIQQDADNPAVFYPRSVTDGGETIKDQTATREVIGREPLIRVDLLNKDNQIIRYGYIKLRITEDIDITDKFVEINLGEMWMDCGDSAKVTWSQMENLILAQLGTNGLTKQEFEKQYYLEVAGEGVKDMPTNANGKLYATAATNNRFAARYYLVEKDGKTVAVKAGPKENVIDNDKLNLYSADDWKKVTAANNYFGRVWYTPHDNSTDAHAWDENTNVLIWQFGNAASKPEGMSGADAEVMSNMNGQYANMIKVLEATADNGGVNAKEVSTVIRFKQVNGEASIYVKLKFDAEKIHFATADIKNRVLNRWFSMTEGYKAAPEKTDTIEVYANVPTPAENGRADLQTNTFVKDLKEYWLDKIVTPTIANSDKFTKNFWNPETGQYRGTVAFQFRLPEEGVNADFSAAADGTWTVKGISGSVYTLKIDATDDTYDKIVATKRGTTAYENPELICRLNRTTGVIEYMGRDQETNYSKGTKGADYAAPSDNQVNGAASDILNFIGYYDAKGNSIKSSYLTGQKDKAFTAFVEIKVSGTACYDPIIKNNFFNVRFLRPINVWPVETKITDAPNETQWINIWELINIKDWRTYGVVMTNPEQGDPFVQKFSDGLKYTGDFVDSPAEGFGKSVPYSFYNITNLYVLRSEIRSDAYLQASERGLLTDATAIKALRKIGSIPALTNDELYYLSIQAYADYDTEAKRAAFAVTAANKGQENTKKADDLLAYTNNGSVSQVYHIYVPIAVEYSWGALADWTQTVWAVITVDPTVGNE